MESLKNLYNEALTERRGEPESNACMYTMADCMDDPVFEKVLAQCEAGEKPDSSEAELVAEVCYHLIVWFAYAREDRPLEYSIRKRAIAAARTVKPFAIDFGWDGLFKRFVRDVA